MLATQVRPDGSCEPTLVVNADQEIGVMLDRERSRLKSDSDDESVDSDDSSHDGFVSIFFRDVVDSQKHHRNFASCQFYELGATCQQTCQTCQTEKFYFAHERSFSPKNFAQKCRKLSQIITSLIRWSGFSLVDHPQTP